MTRLMLIKEPGKCIYPDLIADTLVGLTRTVGGPIKATMITKDMELIYTDGSRLNCQIAGQSYFGKIVIAYVKNGRYADYPYSFDELRRLLPVLFEFEKEK